jgi:hypothetical protein
MPADGWYLNQAWQTPGEQSLESLNAQAAEELAQFAAGGARGGAGAGAEGHEGADESLLQFGARHMASLPPPMFPTSFNTPARGGARGGAPRHANPVPAFAMHSAAQSGVAGPFAPDAAAGGGHNAAQATHAPTVVAPGAIAAKLASQQAQQQQAQHTSFLQTSPSMFEAPADASLAELSHAFPAGQPRTMHAHARDGGAAAAHSGPNPVLSDRLGARRTLQQRVASKARRRAARARGALTREEPL